MSDRKLLWDRAEGNYEPLVGAPDKDAPAVQAAAEARAFANQFYDK